MTDLPIACSLDAAALDDRARAWRALAEEALRDQVATPSGVRLTFAADASVELRLSRLVELERRCCAFARRTLGRDGDRLVLSVEAEDEGIAAVQELFRLGHDAGRHHR